ncbi:uncharacterized protein LOC118438222 [Folsomia candida]|uniref:uncharacterized protein LOC118438222 n=1 Tax=Folsomia candida TaxID=158441 RepID=UPI001604A988|nr:uncharacterized protein LOC118438222 [Folsomia candida]
MFSPKSPNFKIDFPELISEKKIIFPQVFIHRRKEQSGLKKHILKCHVEKSNVESELQVPQPATEDIQSYTGHQPVNTPGTLKSPERRYKVTQLRTHAPPFQAPKIPATTFKTRGSFSAFVSTERKPTYATKQLPPVFGCGSESAKSMAFCKSHKSTAYADWISSLNSPSNTYQPLEIVDKPKEKTLPKIHRSFGKMSKDRYDDDVESYVDYKGRFRQPAGLPFPFLFYGGCPPSGAPDDAPERRGTGRSRPGGEPAARNSANETPTSAAPQNGAQVPSPDLEQPSPATADVQDPSVTVGQLPEDCTLFFQERQMSTNTLGNLNVYRRIQRVTRLLDNIVNREECMENLDDARVLYEHYRENKSFKEFTDLLGQLHQPVYTDFVRFYFGRRPDVQPYFERVSGALSHYGCKYTSKKTGHLPGCTRQYTTPTTHDSKISVSNNTTPEPSEFEGKIRTTNRSRRTESGVRQASSPLTVENSSPDFCDTTISMTPDSEPSVPSKRSSSAREKNSDNLATAGKNHNLRNTDITQSDNAVPTHKPTSDYAKGRERVERRGYSRQSSSRTEMGISSSSSESSWPEYCDKTISMSPNSEPSMPSRKTATAGKKKNSKFMDASRGLNLTRTAINSSDSGNKINKYVIWLQ